MKFSKCNSPAFWNDFSLLTKIKVCTSYIFKPYQIKTIVSEISLILVCGPNIWLTMIRRITTTVFRGSHPRVQVAIVILVSSDIFPVDLILGVLPCQPNKILFTFNLVYETSNTIDFVNGTMGLCIAISWNSREKMLQLVISEHFFPHFLSRSVLIWKKSEDKSVHQSEVHISEVTSYKIHTLTGLLIVL